MLMLMWPCGCDVAVDYDNLQCAITSISDVC